MATNAQDIEAGRLVIATAADFTGVERDMRRMRHVSRESGAGVAADFQEASASSDRLNGRIGGLLQVFMGLAVALSGRVTNGLRGVLGLVGRATSSFLDLGALGAMSAAAGLDRVAESTRNANGELSKTGQAAAVAADGLRITAKAAMIVSGVITGLQVAAAAAAAALIVSAHSAQSEFAPAWARVRTLLKGTPEEIRATEVAVSDMAAEMGVKGAAAADSYYEILSAMPELADDTAGALRILRVALEAGSTGFTDSKTAIKATTGIMNAFGLEADQARRIMDSLFAAQDAGSTTVGEVADSIGSVASVTASLRLEFEDLLGTAGTLTGQNITTSETFTAVRAAITNILKPTNDAALAAEEMTFDFSAAALEAKGLNGFLLDLIRVTGGDTQKLSRFFGSEEALKLVLALAQRTEELTEKTNQIRTASGRTKEVVDTMNTSWTRQKELVGEEMQGALRDLGREFEGLGVVALKALDSIIAKIREMYKTGNMASDFGAQMSESLGLSGLGARIAATARSAQAPVGRGAGLGWTPPAPPAPQAPMTLAPVRVTRAPPPPPAPERTDIEYSTKKIKDYAAALDVTAKAELARSGNMAAYEAATERARQATNRLVLSEMDRLKKAGIGEKAVNGLAALYDATPQRQAAETEAQRAAKRAAERRRAAQQELDQLAASFRTVSQFRDAAGKPFALLDQMPSKLRGAVSEVVEIDRRIAALRKRMSDAGGGDESARATLAAEEALREEALARARRVADDPQNLAAEDLTAAREALERTTEAFRALRATGDDPDPPAALVSAVQAVVGLDEQIRGVKEQMADLRVAGGAPSAQDDAFLADLQRRRAEAVAIVATMGDDLRAALRDMPEIGAELFRGMSAQEQSLVSGALVTTAGALRDVAQEERAAFLARERSGAGSKEAAQAERVLADARENGRARILVEIEAVEASTLSVEEKARAIAALRGQYDALGGRQDKAAKSFAQSFAKGAQDVSSLAQSLGQLGQELGLIDDKTAGIIGGISEMAGAAGEFAIAMQSGNVMGMIQGAVGFIQGAVNFVKGFSGESEGQRLAREAMTSLRQSLDELRESILSQMSSDQVETDRATIDRTAEALERNEHSGSSRDYVRRRALAQSAVELGLIDTDDNKAAAIDALKRHVAELERRYGLASGSLTSFIDNSDPEGLARALRELGITLEEEGATMGTFGDDVAGTIERIRYELGLLEDVDAAEAIRTVTQALLDSSNGLGEFRDELEELAGLDLSTEDGRNRRDELIQAIYRRSQERGADFGAMSPDQLRDLLEEWARASAEGGGVVGAEGSGATRVNVAGTEVQMNELLLHASTQTHHQGQMVELLRGIHVLMAGSGPSMSPIALPLDRPAAESAAAMVAATSVVTHRFEPMRVVLEATPGTLDPDTAGATMEQVGRGFGRGLAEEWASEAKAMGVPVPRVDVSTNGRTR